MPDYNLFKFRDIDKYLIDSLVKGTLYFAHTSKLNDPFDCQLDLQKAAERAAKKVTGEKRKSLEGLASLDGYFVDLQPHITNSGISSFTLQMDNPLLWSHYANEHKGLCLMYEFEEPFLMDSKNEIVGAAPVEYGDNLLTDWLVDNAPRVDGSDFNQFTLDIVKRIFTIKNSCWEHEEEAIIIRPKEGALDIPKNYLKQICFGMNTSSDDIDLVTKLANDSGYKVNYSIVERADSDFGIKFVDL